MDHRSAADKLLERLDGVKRTGADRFMARCPAHADRKGSLSLRALDDGRVLVHCFAGCGVSDIVSALKLELADLFPPRVDDDKRSPHVRRAFSAVDAVRALRGELTVVWVVLSDIATGAPIDDSIRRRARLAQRRCEAMIAELVDG